MNVCGYPNSSEIQSQVSNVGERIPASTSIREAPSAVGDDPHISMVTFITDAEDGVD